MIGNRIRELKKHKKSPLNSRFLYTFWLFSGDIAIGGDNGAGSLVA